MTARSQENHKHNKSENWVKETVDRLLNTDDDHEEEDTDSESDMSTTSSENTAKPHK